MVLELTNETFETEVLKSKKPVIVDFWASWCGPCKMMAPIFEEISKEMKDKLKFAKISTQDYPEVATTQTITGIPCLIIYKDGKELDRIVGLMQKDQLKENIKKILA